MTVDAVERRLAAGHTLSAIARDLGIGRKTVQRIAARVHTAQQQPAKSRCGGCGAKVIAPCLTCHLRDVYKAAA